MKFLGNVLATIVGLVLFTFLGIMVIGGIIAAASADKEVEVKEKTILTMVLDKPLADTGRDDPFSALGGPFAQAGVIGVNEWKEALKRAKEDDKIEGLYINPKFVTGGYALLKELRDAVIDFKSSGKFVIAYSEGYTESGYYIASAADEVHLNPIGGIELNGLESEATFIKGTLDKIGVKPVVFRVGDFKSAVEPFLRTDMSEESRLQTQSFLNSIYDTFLSEVAESRSIEKAELSRISDSMLVRSPEDAINYKIADRLSYADEVRANLAEKVSEEDPDDLNMMSLGRYTQVKEKGKSSKNRIAVVFSSGNIVDGKGGSDDIGSATFVKNLKKAADDDKVKAIVLRINSPGGSALASDVMWREIQQVAKDKPVIASMSSVAASGGYYMAMGCDTIVAQPNTITGSIGIFGLSFNAKELLNDKIGVTTEVVKTGQFSDIFTLTRELSDYEKSIYQQNVERGYEIFTTKAAEGRDMSHEDLLKVASGRVWSGTEAKERGLVDILGGLDTAIEIAAQKAGLEEDDYKMVYYPKTKTFFEQLLEDLGSNASIQMAKLKYGDLYPYVKQMEHIKRYEGIQARMPYDLEVR
ncbi:MAG: signal peptide peptidase SppA [Cyclobacteriaceae bacterium]|nr:signal peptide peptidase SppA [Cyclobacteriaceae bacterium]MCH8515818.1 signal peptide peptidase SppA [Cyclobacteriaceae bacterium]